MSSLANLTKVNTVQAESLIELILLSGLVPYLKSSPGIGKSSLYKAFSKKHRLFFIDLRLSGADRTDLNGLPDISEGKAIFAQFEEHFPLESTPIPAGYDGWFILLDEFPSAPRDVQAASYKLILDKMVGTKHLHPKVMLGLAGNLATDRAIVNPIGTALQSRVVHINLESHQPSWMNVVALPFKYNYRIVAFLSQFPSKLNTFKPDHQEDTFACERTWEFANNLLDTVDRFKKPIDNTLIPLFAGTLGQGVAVEFVQYCQVIKDIVSITDVLKDPVNCKIPTDLSIKWATITSLAENTDEHNIATMLQYIDRFDASMSILYYRSVLVRNPQLRTAPSFSAAMLKLAQFINS